MKLVTKMSDRASALGVLEPNQISFGVLLYDKGYLPRPEYCCQEGVNTIIFLEGAFKKPGEPRIPKRRVNRFIELMESIFAYMTDSSARADRYLENMRHRDLITTLGYERSYGLFKCLRDNQIKENGGHCVVSGPLDVHDFVSNLPAIHDYDDPESLYSAIMRTLKYRPENAMKVLQYLNYKKVREAKNLASAMQHIAIVRAARGGISRKMEATAYAAVARVTPADEWCSFSKRADVVATVGADTNCCFTKGGAASRLLEPAMRSPIAGILHGHKPSRWFSFVWEIVVKEDGMFWKCLVLDNVEARGTIQQEYWENKIVPRLAGLDYRRVYCGTIRNDVEFSELTKGMYVPGGEPQKPYSLTKYENCFSSSIDDSKKLMVICDRQPFTREQVEIGKAEIKSLMERCPKDRSILKYRPRGDEFERWTYKIPGGGGQSIGSKSLKMALGAAVDTFGSIDRNVVLRRMDPGDLHRCKYIEKKVYMDAIPDPDFIRHNVLRSPSMVIESRHAIYGYLLSSLHWIPNGVDMSGSASSWYGSEIERKPKKADMNGFRRVLYVDDIWCISYRKCIAAFVDAMDYIVEWCKINEVNTVVGSTNRFSKGLAARLEKRGLRYEELQEGAGEGERYTPNPAYSPTEVRLELGEPERLFPPPDETGETEEEEDPRSIKEILLGVDTTGTA